MALLIALAVGKHDGADPGGELRRLSCGWRSYCSSSRAAQDWQKQRPFLSANDRSRWATVRALVEHGTYAIDDIVSQPNWDTIDMVKHRGRDGQPHLYSSKPALFPTLMAGEYWVIHKLTGWTLGTHPYEIGRFMLLTINVHAAGDCLRLPGEARRAARHVRLGPAVRDGRGRASARFSPRSRW